MAPRENLRLVRGGGAFRPRIYGSETKCRALLTRHIGRAEELLDQAVGVHKRLEEQAKRPLRRVEEVLEEDGPHPELEEARSHLSLKALFIEAEWTNEVRRWFARAQHQLRPYLQDQLNDLLPVIGRGLPPADGKPRHGIDLDNGVPWLERALDELRNMQAALGVKRDVAKASPAPARFEELHASGLVGEKVIKGYAKEMLSPRTPKQLYDAIGSAKELTEATLRAALNRLGETYATDDDLGRLMKKWRKAIGKVAPPDPAGAQTLDKAQAALANLVTFLAEWRNTYGRGHGRPQYPPGLTKRHARLASDAAETCIRFIVTTMDDLELLPP